MRVVAKGTPYKHRYMHPVHVYPPVRVPFRFTGGASNHQPAHTQRYTGMHEAKGRKSEDRAEYQISNNRVKMDKWHKSVTYDCGDGIVPL
jgi:hypothetical protein